MSSETIIWPRGGGKTAAMEAAKVKRARVKGNGYLRIWKGEWSDSQRVNRPANIEEMEGMIRKNWPHARLLDGAEFVADTGGCRLGIVVAPGESFPKV